MFKFYNADCLTIMKDMKNNSVNATITDIPYGEVSRTNNGLSQMKNSDKGNADIVAFDFNTFLSEVYRITNDSITIFCGMEQVSDIRKFFITKKGTTRTLVWRKTNPVPSNGKYVYLSGIELAVWFKKPKGTFNAFCKNTVFEYPIQSKQIHPTEKNHKLMAELITDLTNEGQLIFDPCAGSCSVGLMAAKANRDFIGCELDAEYYQTAMERLKTEKIVNDLDLKI